MIVEFAFQGALDHHLGQLAQQPALAGQLQPAGAGPLGQLAQHLLIRRRQLSLALPLTGCHVRHWYLLHLGSYTVESTVPWWLLSRRAELARQIMAAGAMASQFHEFR